MTREVIKEHSRNVKKVGLKEQPDSEFLLSRKPLIASDYKLDASAPLALTTVSTNG